MPDTQPPRPDPAPPPDRHQIERLNTLFDVTSGEPRPGWRGVVDRLQGMIARLLLSRQQAFNSVLVDHINRNTAVGIDAHHASERTIQWVQRATDHAVARTDDAVAGALDEMRRHKEALLARERRGEAAIASLAAAHQELRTSLSVLQQAAQNVKREVSRLAEQGSVAPASSPAPALAPAHAPAPAPARALSDSLESHKYVGFEDQFRGSQEDIRARVTEYLPVFQGASDVLDVGCGRGEFLALLREHGVRARGIDVNAAMVDVCRQHGLDASEADALSYLRSLPDGSLGGLFAAQVIEHLDPTYLTSLLDAAFEKLRPGAPIVLETINPACWFAFFESYIRDITHVRAIHPDTLKYLLIATGFQHVEIRYRAPYPEHDKLQPLQPQATLGDSVDILNANVEKINRLLFTFLDYAAIARRS